MIDHSILARRVAAVRDAADRIREVRPERNVLDHDLAARMAAAAGLRNLIAHRYGALDWGRLHDVASNHVEDLLKLCDTLADAAIDGSSEP